MQVYISGVHSGPDPSPGVGIARSLREALPKARLIGVDYSSESSGLQFMGFDDVWLVQRWHEMDLQTHLDELERVLADGWWISGLDVEIAWLASTRLAGHPRLLMPTSGALDQLAKPGHQAAALLGMHVPEYCDLIDGSAALHQFGRRWGWDIWIKGQHHEAYRASSWKTLLDEVARMRSNWEDSDIFIQRHVRGREASFVFAAHAGTLLGALQMHKVVQTETGKTWTAELSPLENESLTHLRQFVDQTSYTGGGEVEFIDGDEHRLYLIDFNPRFPAWIHGATLCGANLPSLLLRAASGAAEPAPILDGRGFTRIVYEIPLVESRPAPRFRPRLSDRLTPSKHPSRMSDLARIVATQTVGTTQRLPSEGPAPSADLLIKLADMDAKPTPCRVFLDEYVSRRIAFIDRALTDGSPKVIPALSVKTMPEPQIARRAAQAGWHAEVVSPGEYQWALTAGFDKARIIVNGPLAPLIANGVAPFKYAFADSVEALSTCALPASGTLGVRIRPPNVESRFGIDLHEFAEFDAALCAIAERRDVSSLATHFHCAPDAAGTGRWWEFFEALLGCAKTIAAATRKPVVALDVGGGWHPDDFDSDFLARVDHVRNRVRRELPTVHSIFIEPGKAVSAESCALLATVVEVRRRRDQTDVVVDASIGNLPLASQQHHPVLHWRRGHTPAYVAEGQDRVLGALCMETDILSITASWQGIPIEPGDRLIFLNAGAYNASMAFPFGGGRLHDSE